MRPAWSVILLTTLIGVGQGLFLALVTVQSYAVFGLLASAGRKALFAWGSAVALMFLAAGLVASFFHLGRPERAWRTAARWRTSWLSREVIVLPALAAVVAAYGLAQAVGFAPPVAMLASGTVIDATLLLGAAGAVLALALFVCTAMIYAGIRFLREWASPLTVANFTLLGGASGFTLAAALAAVLAPGTTTFLAGWALVLTLAGAATRAASLWRNARLQPRSTLQTAIGVKHPRIVQKAAGFLGGSFNTREFFHGRPAATLRSVQWGFLAAAFVAPALLLAAGTWQDSPAALAAAFAVQYPGLLAERWFFLAQANHPQNLYYQATT